MEDASFAAGLLIFPQMYEQLSAKGGGKKEGERKVMAVCPHCGTLNEHPYKFCRECGKRPEVMRGTQTGAGFKVCPYCGTALDLPKPPRFCPYCTERF